MLKGELELCWKRQLGTMLSSYTVVQEAPTGRLLCVSYCSGHLERWSSSPQSPPIPPPHHLHGRHQLQQTRFEEEFRTERRESRGFKRESENRHTGDYGAEVIDRKQLPQTRYLYTMKKEK